MHKWIPSVDILLRRQFFSVSQGFSAQTNGIDVCHFLSGSGSRSGINSAPDNSHPSCCCCVSSGMDRVYSRWRALFQSIWLVKLPNSCTNIHCTHPLARHGCPCFCNVTNNSTEASKTLLLRGSVVMMMVWAPRFSWDRWMASTSCSSCVVRNDHPPTGYPRDNTIKWSNRKVCLVYTWWLADVRRCIIFIRKKLVIHQCNRLIHTPANHLLQLQPLIGTRRLFHPIILRYQVGNSPIGTDPWPLLIEWVLPPIDNYESRSFHRKSLLVRLHGCSRIPCRGRKHQTTEQIIFPVNLPNRQSLDRFYDGGCRIENGSSWEVGEVTLLDPHM